MLQYSIYGFKKSVEGRFLLPPTNHLKLMETTNKEVARNAMKLLRSCTTTNEEWDCMNAYVNLLSDVVVMEGLLESYSGNKESSYYKEKKERLKNIRHCLIKFSECYFSMAKYKTMAAIHKQESLEWQMKYIDLTDKI